LTSQDLPTLVKEERITDSLLVNKDSALIIDFRSDVDGHRYLGGEHYVDFVLQSEICLPAQKVEAVMRQSLLNRSGRISYAEDKDQTSNQVTSNFLAESKNYKKRIDDLDGPE